MKHGQKLPPNILAGEWCKIYKDNNILKQYQYQIAEYHWDDRKKYFKDSIYLRDINAKTLVVLTDALNKYHKVNYPVRFWQILIGPWLHKFIHIVFDKYEILRQISDKYKIEKSFILKLNSENLAPLDTRMFIDLMRDDLWHHNIFSKMLENFFKIKHSFIDVKNIANKFNSKFKNSKIEKI